MTDPQPPTRGSFAPLPDSQDAYAAEPQAFVDVDMSHTERPDQRQDPLPSSTVTSAAGSSIQPSHQQQQQPERQFEQKHSHYTVPVSFNTVIDEGTSASPDLSSRSAHNDAAEDVRMKPAQAPLIWGGDELLRGLGSFSRYGLSQCHRDDSNGESLPPARHFDSSLAELAENDELDKTESTTYESFGIDAILRLVSPPIPNRGRAPVSTNHTPRARNALSESPDTLKRHPVPALTEGGESGCSSRVTTFDEVMAPVDPTPCSPALPDFDWHRQLTGEELRSLFQSPTEPHTLVGNTLPLSTSGREIRAAERRKKGLPLRSLESLGMAPVQKELHAVLRSLRGDASDVEDCLVSGGRDMVYDDGWEAQSDSDSCLSLETDPEIDETHPFHHIKETIVELGLLDYRRYKTTPTGNDRDRHTGRGLAPDPAQDPADLPGGPGKRRLSTNNGGGQGSDENNEGPPRKKLDGANPSDPNIKSRSLACPFVKKDPQRYKDCYSYTITKIQYVKQHLQRFHSQPRHCHRCKRRFESDKELDDHAMSPERCEPNRDTVCEGVTPDQSAQLKKRVPGKSIENQWFWIYEVLFPGAPRPQSPFIDLELEGDLRGFVDHMNERGVGIILRQLEGLGLQSKGQEEHIHSLLSASIASGLHEISRQWRSICNPPLPTLPSLTESESVGDVPRSSQSDNRESSDLLPLVGDNVEPQSRRRPELQPQTDQQDLSWNHIEISEPGGAINDTLEAHCEEFGTSVDFCESTWVMPVEGWEKVPRQFEEDSSFLGPYAGDSG